MINVGSQYNTSKKAVEIAEKYKQGVYVAVGLHPIHAQDNFIKREYQKLAESKKVVAIGEIGLDYKPEYLPFKEHQKKVFLEQLELAKELNLPVIFHCRFAHDDLIEMFNKQRTANNEQLKGVIHCFTGSWEQAKKYLEMGFYLGFNGIIFKFYPVKFTESDATKSQFNRVNLGEIIKKTPLDRILLETDCPYLTPPQEGDKRNEPIYVKYVAEKISQIKNSSYDKVIRATTENAQKLFRKKFGD
jgi:TatD DNase family protein